MGKISIIWHIWLCKLKLVLTYLYFYFIFFFNENTLFRFKDPIEWGNEMLEMEKKWRMLNKASNSVGNPCMRETKQYCLAMLNTFVTLLLRYLRLMPLFSKTK